MVADWLRPFLDTKLLNPHGICLLWRPELLWTHAISDALIGLAYFSIPLTLGLYLYRRPGIQFGWAGWMFVGFIMFCGLTHFMGIWTLWRADYGVEALIKAATAAVSTFTAVALWPLLPRMMALPSSAELEARVAERDQALEKLKAAMLTMVAMEEHQSQQNQLLREMADKEARLRGIFENAAVGIARADLQGRLVEFNARYAEIAGWPADELLTRGFQAITHPDDLEVERAHLQALLTGDSSRYTMEKRYFREDGGVVWISVTASLMRTTDGAPDHFLAIVQDISDEKRLADARLLLMREVDHRARNALMVVQSVVRLTDASDPALFKETVTGRVDALARAQGSLSRSNWEGALLSEVLEQELSSMTAAEHFELNGPPVMLPPETVQPMSMLAHELVTNAAKYGALSTETGRVAVGWRAGADGSLTLTWRETGGPPVAAPTRQGFGSRLIARLAAQLQGETDFEWRPEGLQFGLVMRQAHAWRGGGSAVDGLRAIPAETSG